uniref:Protein OSB3, chloroplastic/mitochondrial n=1 Tax=Anthurium amnicola TaxID=1678845 RepID=A0A1D1XF76_9ARAE
MKLSRTLAGLLSSSRSPKWQPLRPPPALHCPSLSTEAAAKPASRRVARASRAQPRGAEASPGPALPAEEVGDGGLPTQVTPKEEAPPLPKPGEIPWQAKVANSVHLMGRLGAPVQLGTSPNGVYRAVSVLVQEKTHDLPHFWIPVVFQGDLAETAACNLKEKDHVYVTGQLSGEAQLVDNNAETIMQVMVHSISYVLELHQGKKYVRNNEGPDSSSAEVKDDPFAMKLWNDLFANPHKWWDYRSKGNKKSGSFKHKDTGQLLEINESTPEWVLSTLDTFVLSSKTSSTDAKKSVEAVANHWSDLLENPQQWRDNREDKRNGKVKPKFPDFSHKSTKQGLWLDSAPDWVLRKLGSVVVSAKAPFQSGAMKARKVPAREEESWRSLLENFNKWWDNRSDKLNPKAPDFKHKETGVALWLGSSTPEWVMDKLPPPKAEKKKW